MFRMEHGTVLVIVSFCQCRRLSCLEITFSVVVARIALPYLRPMSSWQEELKVNEVAPFVGGEKLRKLFDESFDTPRLVEASFCMWDVCCKEVQAHLIEHGGISFRKSVVFNS